jgi:plastocyanin
MKWRFIMKLRLLTIRFLLGFFFVCAAQANSAVLHTVQFGGNLGLTFSPKSFSATVGDTVEWDGDFGPHVLSSTTIPAGAASWHNATGTTFRYVITVAGSYNYQCDIHVSLGMIGSFTASGSAVREIPRLSGVLSRNSQLRIVASPTLTPTLEFQIQSPSVVRLELLDMKGRMISLRVPLNIHQFST